MNSQYTFWASVNLRRLSSIRSAKHPQVPSCVQVGSPGSRKQLQLALVGQTLTIWPHSHDPTNAITLLSKPGSEPCPLIRSLPPVLLSLLSVHRHKFLIFEGFILFLSSPQRRSLLHQQALSFASENLLVLFVDALAFALVFAAGLERLQGVLLAVALEPRGSGLCEEELAV